MYGRCRGYEVPFLNESHLTRKKQLAKESIAVLKITEPGISTIKGYIDFITVWGGRLCKRFCNMFSGSSSCLLGQHGSCSSAQLPVEL